MIIIVIFNETKTPKIQIIVLLSCPSYDIQRVTLVTSVNEILLKVNLNHSENQSQLYLYGDPSITNSNNKNILLSTIKYIKETQRFST